MRIKIEGQITQERVMEVLADFMRRHEDADSITGFNMYLTVRNSRGCPLDFVREDGTISELVIYRESRETTPLRSTRSRTPKKQKPKLSVVKNDAKKSA